MYFGLQPQTAGGGEQRVTVPAGAGGESGGVRRSRQRRRVCGSREGHFRQHSVPPGHAHPQPKVPDHRLVVVEVPCFVHSFLALSTLFVFASIKIVLFSSIHSTPRTVHSGVPRSQIFLNFLLKFRLATVKNSFFQINSTKLTDDDPKTSKVRRY